MARSLFSRLAARARALPLRAVAAVAIASAAASTVPPAACATDNREYEIKAGFLFNFVKFVEWPGEAFAAGDSTIVVGVLGNDPFGDAINALEGKTASGRRIAVRRYTKPEEASSAHVLFISDSETKALPAIFKTLASGNALTVGDSDGFTEAGGVIRFYQKKNKMRVEINTAAAERAALKISSKLLNIADIAGT
ncbi:MAG: YfiR family protein [bacterium]